VDYKPKSHCLVSQCGNEPLKITKAGTHTDVFLAHMKSRWNDVSQQRINLAEIDEMSSPKVDELDIRTIHVGRRMT